jgi:hypothetical protein
MLAEQPELEHSCSQIASFHVHIYHVPTHIETCRAYLLIKLLQLRVTLDVVGDCARAAAMPRGRVSQTAVDRFGKTGSPQTRA